MKTIKGYYPAIHGMRYLLIALVALVVSDGVISHFLVAGGLGWEWNPLLRTLVGKEYFLVIKLLAALLSALILWDVYRKWPKLGLISTSCLVLVYTGMVLWNLSLFFIA